jgi:hypothetical protein
VFVINSSDELLKRMEIFFDDAYRWGVNWK